MKLTDTQIIKNAERELIDGIIADLDWAVIEGVFRDRHDLEIGEDVAFRNGDLVVHGDQVNYQLDFEVKVRLRLVMDRDGNCLSVGSTGSASPSPVQVSESPDKAPSDKSGPRADEAMGDAGGTELHDFRESSGDPAGVVFASEPEDRIAGAASRVNAALNEMAGETWKA